MSTAQALRAYAKAQIENWPAPENAVATVCRGSLCSDDVPIVEGPLAVGTPPLQRQVPADNCYRYRPE